MKVKYNVNDHTSGIILHQDSGIAIQQLAFLSLV